MSKRIRIDSEEGRLEKIDGMVIACALDTITDDDDGYCGLETSIHLITAKDIPPWFWDSLIKHASEFGDVDIRRWLDDLEEDSSEKEQDRVLCMMGILKLIDFDFSEAVAEKKEIDATEFMKGSMTSDRLKLFDELEPSSTSSAFSLDVPDNVTVKRIVVFKGTLSPFDIL